jgi:hypothetical protein
MKISDLTPEQLCGKEKINGGLDLSSVTSLPEGFAPTVGGGLYLSSVTSLPEGFAPTVGGGLDLSSVTSLPEGFAPTVGGGLDLSSVTKPTPKKRAPVYPLTWLNGKYLLIDGIVSEVVQKRGDSYRVKVVGKRVVTSLVTDGRNWAHGATLKEASADLIYKNKGTDTSEYKSLTLASKLTFAEGIACYRAITGACSFGVRNFVEMKGVAQKKFSIQQIIDMTNGQYGGDTFKRFFVKT